MSLYKTNKNEKIRKYNYKDEDKVVKLWEDCNLTRSWNNPHLDIIRKIKVDHHLFLVVQKNNDIIATIMGGYDGHRGVINYLAVHPQFRRKGLARKLISVIEGKLIKLGCPKINLLVRSTNIKVVNFYKKLDYQKQNDVVIMGKRLIPDN